MKNYFSLALTHSLLIKISLFLFMKKFGFQIDPLPPFRKYPYWNYFFDGFPILLELFKFVDSSKPSTQSSCKILELRWIFIHLAPCRISFLTSSTLPLARSHLGDSGIKNQRGKRANSGRYPARCMILQSKYGTGFLEGKCWFIL